MKIRKMIAVLAISAFVAGGAFAQQVTVGGGVIVGMDVARGDDADGSEVYTAGTEVIVRLQASASVNTPVGQFGSWIRVQPTWMSIAGATGWGSATDWAGTNSDVLPIDINFFNGYAWWAPNDMFRLTLGTNPDGWWPMSGPTRWGFYQMALDAGVARGFGVGNYSAMTPGMDEWTPGYNPLMGRMLSASFAQAFFPATEEGLLLSLTPNDMITVNFGLPVSWRGAMETGDAFGSSLLQLGLNLDFGSIGLTYQLTPVDSHNGNVWAYFSLTAVDNLGLDFGVGAELDDDPIIAVGLGVRYSFNPEFNLAVRTMAKIDTMSTDYGDAPLQVLFEILPSYVLAPGITAFLGAGIAFTTATELFHENEATFGWHVNPYVRFGSQWGPSFYAGFELRNWHGDRGNMEWRIPIGVYLMF
jgi:hypothetical protein